MWWQLEAQKNLGHKKEKGEEGNNVCVVMIIMIMITMIEIRKMFFRLVTSVGQRKNSESPKTFVWRVFVQRSWTDCENVDASWTLYESKSAYPIQTHSNKPFGYSLFWILGQPSGTNVSPPQTSRWTQSRRSNVLTLPLLYIAPKIGDRCDLVYTIMVARKSSIDLLTTSGILLWSLNQLHLAI